LAGAVARVCSDAGAKEVALSGAEIFAEMNFSARLAAHGLSSFRADDFGAEGHDELIARLEACGAGLTAVDYAIAETGTVALASDEEGALLVSLLPAIHVAVLRRSQIVGSLGAAIGKLKAERMARDEPSRSATFITGPSRTSDVELVLSIGVHGPKELHLIILGE
jgi:L-lactate dehydrogenase complex protein LldG